MKCHHEIVAHKEPFSSSASFSPSPKWCELALVLFLPSSSGVWASLSSAGVASPPLNRLDDRTLDWAVLLTLVSTVVELVLLVLEMVVVFSDTTVSFVLVVVVLLLMLLLLLSCSIAVDALDAFISTRTLFGLAVLGLDTECSWWAGDAPSPGGGASAGGLSFDSSTSWTVSIAVLQDRRRGRSRRSRYLPLQVVRHQLSLALDRDEPALLERVAEGLQYLAGFLRHLDGAGLARAFHSGRHIYRVAPDVVVGFARSNHARRNRPMVDAHLQHEMVERLLVDALQRFLQLERKLYQQCQVGPPDRHRIVRFDDAGRVETARRHKSEKLGMLANRTPTSA
uniref:Uncharacterized protein n=1 Tax=Anopheles merus TaxID=30066 RepID=A0A182V4Y9_ANOME